MGIISFGKPSTPVWENCIKFRATDKTEHDIGTMGLFTIMIEKAMVLDTYIVTFNCARTPISPSILASHLVSGLSNKSSPPDVFVLCLQEVAPLAYVFLAGSYLDTYLEKFEQAVDLVAKTLDGVKYDKVAIHHIGMTAIMVFVNSHRTESVLSSKKAGVGVGLLEMGNKGAAGVRILYQAEDSEPVTVTILSAHLAAMEEAVHRRNQDWAKIVRRTVFDSEPGAFSHSVSDSENTPLLASARGPAPASTSTTSGIFASDYLILAGDLNYRTSSSSPSPADQAHFPQPCEDDSYPQNYAHLLTFDQLAGERKAGRVFQGLSEAAVDFPPTYKYSDQARQKLLAGDSKAESMDDIHSGRWEWAKHRWPSWCDRVLYLKTLGIEVIEYKALPLMSSSDHRPVVCELRMPLVPKGYQPPGNQRSENARLRSDPPFTIDPYWRARRAAARQLEILVGVLAFMTTTWEAIWIWSGLMLIVIVFGTGALWWDSY